MKSEIVIPDPQRMIEGLRDTGYTFNTAIADIVDNSISANADIVDILIRMDLRGNIRISIADDGIGMNRGDLINAMKYGSQRRKDPFSLGKFGLGLKTASTAFCRRLSVVSKKATKDELVMATWDLDHVAKINQWELLFSDPEEEAGEQFKKIAKKGTGTVVLWTKVDRLLKSYQDPRGQYAQKALEKYTTDLKFHLGMVYQMFLEKTFKKVRDLTIQVNGEKIVPWDPFCTGNSEEVASEKVQVELDGGKKAEFGVRAYVLPRREEFTDQDKAKNARIGNEMQGIYIYREHRLIHYADWMGIFSKEPHGSLLRVRFSFDHHLDAAFHIDIKKSQILLNEDLYDWLQKFLAAPRRAADDRYRKGQKQKAADAAAGAHTQSNVSIASKEDKAKTAEVLDVDEKKGEVEIENKGGKVLLKLKIGKPMRPGECYVQPVDSIDDGMLWQPALIEKHQAVTINRGHPYYSKVYVPNLASGVTIQGMDSLLWALCAAELGTISEATKTHFVELRYEVSRLLRILVEDLPEPELNENE
jgi:hypothetical protein